MNVRKHLAGFAIFSIILGSTVFINYFLTLPNPTIPPVPLRPLVADAIASPNFSYKVRQVSLDFAKVTGYTSLSLRLRSGQPAPETIWVTTYFFSPEIAGSGWSSTTQIHQPFAAGDEVELVATDSLDWGSFPKTREVSYFARVGVSSWPSDVKFARDITTAMPVVVHWPDKKSVSASAAKKFSR